MNNQRVWRKVFVLLLVLSIICAAIPIQMVNAEENAEEIISEEISINEDIPSSEDQPEDDVIISETIEGEPEQNPPPDEDTSDASEITDENNNIIDSEHENPDNAEKPEGNVNVELMENIEIPSEMVVHYSEPKNASDSSAMEKAVEQAFTALQEMYPTIVFADITTVSLIAEHCENDRITGHNWSYLLSLFGKKSAYTNLIKLNVAGDGISIISDEKIVEKWLKKPPVHLRHLVFDDGIERLDGPVLYGFANMQRITLPATLAGKAYYEDVEHDEETLIKDEKSSERITVIEDTFTKFLSGVEEIKVDNKNPVLYDTEGVLFQSRPEEESGDVLLRYPSLKEGSEYYVPESTVVLADYAFAASEYVDTIFIPSSVELIGENLVLDAKTTTLHFMGMTPPEFSGEIGASKNMIISVPNGALEAYEGIKKHFGKAKIEERARKSTARETSKNPDILSARINAHENDTYYIDLNLEQFHYPANAILAAYSTNAGKKWVNSNLQDAQLRTMLNNGGELWISDKPYDAKERAMPADASIIKFPIIEKRPVLGSYAINYTTLADSTMKTLGAWTLSKKGEKAVSIDGIQYATQNTPNAEWKNFPNEGIAVLDSQSKKQSIYIRSAPIVSPERNVPSSKIVKITPLNASAMPKYKANYNLETISVPKGVQAFGGTYAELNVQNGNLPSASPSSMQKGATCVSQTPGTKISISHLLNTAAIINLAPSICIQTIATDKKPASEIQEYTLAPRANAPSMHVTNEKGNVTLEKTMQYRDILTWKWGNLPKFAISANINACIRTKPTAKPTGIVDTGFAASFPSDLMVVYGKTSANKDSVIEIKVTPPGDGYTPPELDYLSSHITPR